MLLAGIFYFGAPLCLRRNTHEINNLHGSLSQKGPVSVCADIGLFRDLIRP